MTNVKDPDYHFKQRLAFGILHAIGDAELNEDQKKLMINISEEYEFIKNKNSSLSRMKRDQITDAYFGIQNTLSNREKQKEEEEEGNKE